jgi:hypothetical protein
MPSCSAQDIPTHYIGRIGIAVVRIIAFHDVVSWLMITNAALPYEYRNRKLRDFGGAISGPGPLRRSATLPHARRKLEPVWFGNGTPMTERRITASFENPTI